MRRLDPRDPANIEELEAVIAGIEAEWRDEPNVVAIAPGIKMRDDSPLVDTLAIQFFVRRKVTIDECDAWGWKRIPEEIGDIPTDVESTICEPAQLPTRSQRFDPLVGGISIRNMGWTAGGTLGGILLTDDADRTPVGLTCEHVLIMTNLGAVGDPVVQPHGEYESEVRVVDADCCPDGHLSFDAVPNPLRDAMTATTAAASIAAAASDVIDPHRRGQENTPVADGERTMSEHVHMHVAYPEIPLPGTQYGTEVSWKYTRFTDRGEHHHAVEKERAANPHVLKEQELITAEATYEQGAIVYYLAAIAKPGRRLDCSDEHVVAHAVAPSEGHLQSTILRPVQEGDVKLLTSEFSGLDPTQPLMPQFLFFGDFDWASVPPAGVPRFEHRGFEVVGIGGALLRFSDEEPRPIPDGMGELTIPTDGLSIRLPVAAEMAGAAVYGQHPDPIVLTAYEGDRVVGSDSGGGDGVASNMLVTASNMTRVTFTGGGGLGKLLLFGSARSPVGRACIYWGRTRLPPDAELGLWLTYLVVQTTNDVPVGANPAEAARTIGGLVSSQNLVSGGRRSELPFGQFCAIDSMANGAFKVVEAGHSD